MKRVKVIVNSVILFASTALVADQAAAVQDQPVKAEVSEADKADLQSSATTSEKWLQLVDEGNYHDSWESMALTSKLRIPEASWTTILETSRKPLGSVTNRKVLEQKAAFDPQGLPQGKYMVIFYGTSFSGKANGNELVTLMKLDDGSWKVLTYLVK